MAFDPLQWWVPVLVAPLIGSFISVLVTRLPDGGAVVLGRSACPHCGHRLAARDLVPVLSWALNRGCCRYCTARLGLLYPGIEVGALVIAAWAATATSGWLLWATCGLGWTLIALAAIDLRHQILPNTLTLSLIPAGLLAVHLEAPASVADHAIGAVVGFTAFYLIAELYRWIRKREGLGLGDAKLFAAAGAWVSWWGLPGVLLVAASSALAVVLVRSLAGSRATLDLRLAFGPYLCLGLWIVWLYGPVM